MADKFKRNADGTYTASYLDGYVATITKVSDRWQLLFGQDGKGKKRIKPTYWWTLRDAKDEARDLAADTFTEVENLVTRKKVKLSVDTPWSCNPASETYHSM